jgi:hypothetical protein
MFFLPWTSPKLWPNTIWPTPDEYRPAANEPHERSIEPACGAKPRPANYQSHGPFSYVGTAQACPERSPRSSPARADFVSKATTGVPFNEFIANNAAASKIMEGFADAANLSAKEYFQSEPFHLRNRIAHWGDVNASKDKAQRCHNLAVAIVCIFREMDRIKFCKV